MVYVYYQQQTNTRDKYVLKNNAIIHNSTQKIGEEEKAAKFSWKCCKNNGWKILLDKTTDF